MGGRRCIDRVELRDSIGDEVLFMIAYCQIVLDLVKYCNILLDNVRYR